MKKQLLIGITGGIGSGKSLICKTFHKLGVPVYYADDRAKWLMNHAPSVKKSVIDNFGVESYNEKGLDNIYLAKKVFTDAVKLKTLNGIIHPAVAGDFLHWAKRFEGSPYLLKEAALIFESGSYKALDYVINVEASEEIRMDRVLLRDPFRDREQVKNIMLKQLSDAERRKRSDFTIINDNSQLVIPQVLELHHFLIKKNSDK